MPNPIIQALTSGNNVMMQAVGAMIRGESPQAFLQNLAKTDPRLSGLDLSNPNKAAENLYAQKGQDINAARTSIQDSIYQFISNKPN